MGSYTSASDDKNVFPDDSELFFDIIETQECGEHRVKRVVQSMVPTTWLSNDGKFVLCILRRVRRRVTIPSTGLNQCIDVKRIPNRHGWSIVSNELSTTMSNVCYLFN